MILAVGNVKGGVGKTTLAVNLVIALAHAKREVCSSTAMSKVPHWRSPTCALARGTSPPVIRLSRCMERTSAPRSASSPPNTRKS